MVFKIFLTLACSALILSSEPAFAKAKRGTESCGGGDASEARVNEIRADILNWIEIEGAKGLIFLSELTYDDYVIKMKDILEPQKVVIGFVENDDTKNPELMVSVAGVPKTCRGFLSKKDSRHHILCNISRFEAITDSEQYELIHHEFAGLVNIENNDGAASDYSISNQISGYLEDQVVKKLVINPTHKKGAKVDCKVSIDGKEVFNRIDRLDHEIGEAEGSGSLLLGTVNNVQVHVTSYPLMIVANFIEDGISIKNKTSGVLSLLLRKKEVTLNTKLVGVKVNAVCKHVDEIF